MTIRPTVPPTLEAAGASEGSRARLDEHQPVTFGVTEGLCTDTAAPVLAGVRLRVGRAGSAKGAASVVTEAVNTALAVGAQPASLLVRGDSAYCTGKVVTAVVKAGAVFSFAIARNPAVDAAALAAIC